MLKRALHAANRDVKGEELRLPSLESDCPHCTDKELVRPQFSNFTDHEKNIYCTIILWGSNTSPN